MSDFKKMVKVHNNFVEAIYSLDKTAKKLLLSVILHLNDDNKIKISREELIREVITIREINSSNFAMYQLLKATKYENGMFYTSVYTDLLPYFREVKDRLFTKFNILNIKPLTSTHAIRIYEMCKQFESTGWLTLEVDELRKRIFLVKEYKRISDFKKRVLEVAKNQINKNTDIEVSYKLRKQGKSYKFIDFKIKKKELEKDEPKLLDVELSDLQKELKKLLGKRIMGKDKIISFSLQGNNIIVTTEAGDYTFPNLETLKKNIK